ncbi:solute carrier family 12 member 9-like isoform X2 [Gordionus sp. m RMFG-2023]
MISRTLGPEFGGSIGAIFFFANVFSSALYCVGCSEALVESFGPGGTYSSPKRTNSNITISPEYYGYNTRILPEGLWWSILYASCVNALNLIICLFGSSAFARASLTVLGVIVVCALSIPLSVILKTDPTCIDIPNNNIIVYPPHQRMSSTPSLILSTTFSHLDFMVNNTLSNLISNVTAAIEPTSTTNFTSFSPISSAPTMSPLIPSLPTCGNYTGFKVETLMQNMKPQYSIDYTTGFTASFMTVFAVVFSGATGIMAGANMSGDLKDPQKSIPKGTLWAVAFTFTTYIILSILIAATCSSFLLKNDYMVLAQINIWPPFITIGILLATITAGLSNLIGASRVLEAVARDNIFGSMLQSLTFITRSGNPIKAVVMSWLLVQVAIIVGGGSLNKIAGIVTVSFLLSYLAVNVSCCALDLASAPNFRPSFTHFSWHSALLGSGACLVIMFAVAPTFSALGLTVCAFLVALLHWKTPASSWGSLSQALLFHQVRKYLLLLDPRKQHVKYWRPQILQLIADPRYNCELIDFVNDLKKSGLFVLGHVILRSHSQPTEETSDLVNLKTPYWLTLIDGLRVKAFVELTISDTVREGARQLIRLSGLGAMKPNTIILGFYDDDLKHNRFSPLFEKVSEGNTMLHAFDRQTPKVYKNLFDADEFVGILNDCLSMGKNVVLTRNFRNFDKLRLFNLDSGISFLRNITLVSDESTFSTVSNFKKFQTRCLNPFSYHISTNNGLNKTRCYVDVWPQNFFNPLGPTIRLDNPGTLFLLQLACVLNMRRDWNKKSTLRVLICLDPQENNFSGDTNISSNDNLRFESPDSINKPHNNHTLRELKILLNQLRIPAKIKAVDWSPGRLFPSLFNSNCISENNNMVYTNGDNQVNPDTLFLPENDYLMYVNKLVSKHSIGLTPINENIIQTPSKYESPTAVCFMYLPKPSPKFHKEYLFKLDILTKDLPPLCMVHGINTVTTTTL